MNRSFIKELLFLYLLVFSFPVFGQIRQDQLLNQIETTLDSSYVYFDLDARLQTGTSVRFDSLFNLLVDLKKATPRTKPDESSIREKVAAIALYKVQHPELFAEIENRYIAGVHNPLARAPRSPHLSPEHLTESYRLVWEYYLLKPPARGMSAQYDQRAAQALSIINNVASLPTFESVYRYTTRTRIPLENRVVQKQQLILTNVAAMPSEAGFKSALSMLSIENKAPYPNRNIDWKPAEFFKERIEENNNIQIKIQWNQVIRNLDTSKLDLKSKRIMDTLKLKN